MSNNFTMKSMGWVSFIFTLLLTGILTQRAAAQQKPIRPDISGIAHAAFFSRNVDSTMQFYTNYLGFEAPAVPHVHNKDFSLVKISNRQFIEIFPEKQKGGSRLFHFSLQTNNARKMRRYLLSKGLSVPEKVSKNRLGDLIFSVTDPNGTKCEFIQYCKSNKTLQGSLSAKSVSQRMRHVGFMVPDLDKAMSFYREILGFKETWRGSSNQKNVTWVTLEVPNGTDYIELMLFDKVLSDEDMGVLNHICLEVKDVSKTAEILAARTLPSGTKPTTAIRTGINKKRQINCFDLDKTRVEIMEDDTIDGKPPVSSAAPPLKFMPKRDQ